MHQERKTAVLDYEMAKEKLGALQSKSAAAAKATAANAAAAAAALAAGNPNPFANANTPEEIEKRNSITKRETVDIPKAKELLEKNKREYDSINSAGKKKLLEIHEKRFFIFFS